jgi:hypothetical protein
LTDPLYIRLGLTVKGPYSLTDLHELALRGSFSKSHEVSADKKSWTSASSHPELFPVARRPASVEGKKQNGETMDSGSGSRTSSAAAENSQSSHAPSRSHLAPDEASRLTGSALPVRDVSKQSLWVAIIGPVGFILLLVCTAMIVLRLRSSPFRPGENVMLIILLSIDLVLGGAAVALGSFAIRVFQRRAGKIGERNLIVIGLSCGYTILILCILYFVVLLISAVG